MKNVWKGLVVGGLTGVAAGIVLDALARGAREASALGDKVAQQAPEVAGRLRHAVTEAVADSASKVRDPEVADHLTETSDKTKKAVAEAASGGKTKVTEATARAKQKMESALADGKARALAASGDVKDAANSIQP